MLANIRLFIALTFWFGASTPAIAQSRVALVMGNSSYAHVSKLVNPANDANAVGQLLTSAGFNKVDVRLDLNLEQTRKALRDFSEVADGSDVALVFYAGHGIEFGGGNYIVPVDARLRSDRDIDYEALSLDVLLRATEGAKGLRLVLLDACRDNPFVPKMNRAFASRSIGRGLAKIEIETADTLVGFAARAGSTASDGNEKHSPYTSALLKHLATPGEDIRLVLGEVRDEVVRTTSPKQEPFTYGSLGGKRLSIVPAVPLLQTHKAVDSGATLTTNIPSAAAVVSSRSGELKPDIVTACDRVASTPWDIDRHPDVPIAHSVKFGDLKNPERCKSSIDSFPDSRRLLVSYARVLLLDNPDPDLINSALEKAISMGSVAALSLMGDTLLEKGEETTAAKFYEKAMELGERARAASGLASALWPPSPSPVSSERVARAIALLQEAQTNSDPRGYEHYAYQLVSGHSIKKDRQKGHELFQKAIEVGGGAYTNLAFESAMQEGHAPEAEWYAKKSLELSNQPHLLHSLILAYEQGKHLERPFPKNDAKLAELQRWLSDEQNKICARTGYLFCK